MRIRLCCPALLLFALVLPARAQPALWEAQAALRSVNQIAAAPGAVWAASEGGVFRYALDGGSFERYSLTDGLSDTRAAAIAYDARRDAVWIGYASGVLDRLDAATGAVTPFRDIARADRFSERGVTRLRVVGDTLFVATDFGVVVFDAARGEVRDTYSQMGALPQGTAVFDVAVAPGPTGAAALWASTAAGLAAGPLDGRNLQDPASWQGAGAGLPAGATRGLAVFAGRLFVATPRDLYARGADGRWQPAGYGGSEFFTLAASPQYLVAAERYAVVLFRADGASQRVQPAGGIETRDIALVDGVVAVADANRSIALLETPTLALRAFVTPPGPGFNLVLDMDFAPDGTLWTSSSGGNGEGFQRRAPDGTWTVYDRRQQPDPLEGRGSFLSAEVAPDGTAWFGSFGNGVVSVAPDGALQFYDRNNSSLRTSFAANPDFIRVDGLGFEADGTLWATNRFSTVPLHVRLPDGTWHGFAPLSGGGLLSGYTAYDQLLVDGFGTKWITLRDERSQRNGRGLVVYSSGADPISPADDAFRYFGQEGGAGSGLPGLLVTSLAEDREGRIWIGTEKGIAYLVNNGIVPRDNTANFVWPVDADARAYVLLGLRVNALAIDPANNVWVGSEEGLWRVEEREGGFAVADHFTVENAPLPSNRVLSLAINPATGDVYVGTEGGLVAYRGGVVAPAASARDLRVYPNPLRLPGADYVTIEGLVEATQLRILTPDGHVVRRMDTRGGSVRWDGRDGAGRPVPSGVYLVVAVGQEGEGAAYGKVAVIR